MALITRNNDQTLADVAVQHAGEIEAMIGICLDNDISLTDESATELKVNLVNKYVAEQLNKKQNIPASNIDDLPGGVDYWAAGLDYIIQ